MPQAPLSSPLVHASRGELPVLLSIPHAGRDYPAWLLAMAAAGPASLHALEDPLVDRLASRTIERGIGAVVARAPRAAVDCNRSEDELDPAVIDSGPVGRLSPRARGGLGIIPGRTTTHGPLWRRPIGREQLEERLDQAYRPYHDAIERELAALAERFGCALLLDCHSMPAPPAGVPPVVIGDRHGRSAAPWLTAEAVRIAASAGYRASVNEPFAGGHILERHAAPQRDIHALQVEIDRRCYLDSSGQAEGPGADRAALLVERLALVLGEMLLDRRFAAAAE